METSNGGIIIGGSPSTGSSVLVNILNRHPDLLAGPETYLFIHPKLYTGWPRYREFLIKSNPFRGLKSIGWFRRNGADLMDAFYGWEREELESAVRASGDFPAFAASYFNRPLLRKGARRWVEKSPSNALCFDHFLRTFPGGKVIHTARDPYDTIASLVSRGYTPFYAAAAYLVNTAFALKALEEQRHFLLRYEDWVREPETELPRLFLFLELEWSPSLLMPAEGEGELRMPGWMHSEKGRLAPGSIGRFFRLKQEDQDRIRYAVNYMQLEKSYTKRFGLSLGSIPEIIGRLGYEPQTPGRSYGNEYELLRLKDRLDRLIRLYPTGLYYPIST